MVKAQTSTSVSVEPQNSVSAVSQTLTIRIQINNVQNLYGLDVTLDYDSAILQLANAQPDLGSAAISGGGVLHGAPVTTNLNNLQPGSLYYNTSLSTSNEYRIFATSVASAPAFSGGGTIVTLTFQVLAAGKSPLTLSSTLADYPSDGETSNPIAHTDISGTVVATLSSSSPTPTATPTPSPTPLTRAASAVPVDMIAAVIVAVVVALLLVGVVLSRKKRNKLR
ncbi:MAG TPA: cohesin domain-containing protein [Candidatus Limnocylindrales bacterium]|nr:cohesin domain-containing protein [Candidatus Limnocylindrales bacterium]